MSLPSSQHDFLALQAALSGRYILERELGRGGMGAVFLARDLALERAVAIKMLLPHLANDEEQRERFVREARTAAQLMHPNIVPIHSVEAHGELVCFVMAFIEGETLTQRVARTGTLTPNEARRVMRDVAWALAFAHGRGVVHRDIKPDNILLEHASGRAMVADFGIARVASSDALGEEGMLVGTVHYMSPEQASAEPLDGRSDIYSLGASIYFALVGRSPVEAASMAATLTRLLTEESPSPLHERPELPSPFTVSLSRAMARDISKRSASAESLAAELQEQERALPSIRSELRWFLTQVSQAKMVVLIGLVGAGTAAAFRAFGMLESQVAGVLAFLSGTVVLIGPGSVFVGLLGLKRQGIALDETARAIEHDFNEVREAFRNQQTRFDATRWKRETGAIWLFSGGFFLILGISELMVGSRFRGVNIMMVGFGAVFTLAGIILLSGIGSRSQLVRNMVQNAAAVPPKPDVLTRILSRVLNSAPARWMFGQEKKLSDGSRLTPTPTFLLRRVEGLLDELPRELERRFPDVRSIARGLERAGDALRMQVSRLDRGIAELSGTSDAGEELRGARNHAAARLVDCTLALETLRSDLLRLNAGVGTPDGLTLALEKARELSAAIDAELHGQSEVKRLLG